jgi:hypothetical protein
MSHNTAWRSLPDTLGNLIHAILTWNQPGGVAVTDRLERELRIDSLMEEASRGHRECAQSALVGASNRQATVPTRHFEHGIWIGLISSQNACKRGRVNGRLPAVPMPRKTLDRFILRIHDIRDKAFAKSVHRVPREPPRSARVSACSEHSSGPIYHQ